MKRSHLNQNYETLHIENIVTYITYNWPPSNLHFLEVIMIKTHCGPKQSAKLNSECKKTYGRTYHMAINGTLAPTSILTSIFEVKKISIGLNMAFIILFWCKRSHLNQNSKKLNAHMSIYIVFENDQFLTSIWPPFGGQNDLSQFLSWNKCSSWAKNEQEPQNLFSKCAEIDQKVKLWVLEVKWRSNGGQKRSHLKNDYIP